MTRAKPARSRPRHASPSLLAPRRRLLAAGTLALLAGLGIAGCAAVAGSRPASSRPQAGGPSIPHLVLDRAVAANPVAFRAADIGAGITGTWFTTGAPPAGTPTTPGPTAAAALDTTTPSALADSGIPVTALTAYKQAAVREAARRPACGLVWPLLAGIGRVESDHGRFAGALLHTDGYSTPRIVGIPLNGHGTALILDTDHGRLDGDTVYDRAVGPMQFIPSTWAGWGVDANHDGRADPNNIFDAAAAAADYLCAAGRDLHTYAGQVQAVRSYNDSDAYIALVLGLEKDYASGAVGVTIPVLPTDPKPGTVHPPHPPVLPPVDPGKPRGLPKPKPKPTPSPTTSAPGSPSNSGPSTPSVPPSGSSSDPGSGTGNGTPPTDGSTGSASSGPPTSDPPTATPPPTDPAPTDTSSTTTITSAAPTTPGAASDPTAAGAVSPADPTSAGSPSA
ncbi:MAG TPA: lytic murein transglycosylase [Jatrophihabitans sp.]|jgi:membrane-bound lytic murein transglycosylase B|uniref:lytic murein transglycosylase n=1 Tax=Jatrophihabitans sp. TaxID=1932789 RepID=UPI002E0CDA83|nr:lytic murein transglycosylase [Jatrophihabitans sp.]